MSQLIKLEERRLLKKIKVKWTEYTLTEYTTEIIKTSFVKILELLNFGLMNVSTI